MALPLLPILKSLLLDEVVSRVKKRFSKKANREKRLKELLKQATEFHVCAGRYESIAITEDNHKGENIKFSNMVNNLTEALVDGSKLVDTQYDFVFIEHLGQRSYLKF